MLLNAILDRVLIVSGLIILICLGGFAVAEINDIVYRRTHRNLQEHVESSSLTRNITTLIVILLTAIVILTALLWPVQI